MLCDDGNEPFAPVFGAKKSPAALLKRGRSRRKMIFVTSSTTTLSGSASPLMLVADQLPALGERPRPAAVLDLRRNRPGVDSLLDPDTLPCANSALKVSLHGASQNARSSSN
jgi:hypothetical protein